ncbi:MAG: hypothetical protein KDC76_14570, partial [Bacteroidetes bacterium]|nr:hypothetical protein [Bacteroidota bacterium]
SQVIGLLLTILGFSSFHNAYFEEVDDRNACNISIPSEIHRSSCGDQKDTMHIGEDVVVNSFVFFNLDHDTVWSWRIHVGGEFETEFSNFVNGIDIHRSGEISQLYYTVDYNCKLKGHFKKQGAVVFN